MAAADFISRIIGLFLFTIIGGRLGIEAARPLALPSDATALIFGLVGALFGLILTPWLTVRPLHAVNQTIRKMPVDIFMLTLLGAFIGLSLTLLMAYPFSQLPAPLNQWLPPVASLLGMYIGVTVFSFRGRELLDGINERAGGRGKMLSMQSSRQLVLDTSVLIDGRIVEIAKTGFLGGTLIIPRFVLSELQRIADSSDMLRRRRGQRGLIKVTELQRNDLIPVRIVDDDPQGAAEVDDKLVLLAIQLDAYLITNDYPLNKVAEGQGVTVLNINTLANAVRPLFIPGESFPLHIFQEGRDSGQGVGYLDDGTMVVVENGRGFMDRTIEVKVTKLINGPAGRMIFAVPDR